MNKTRVADAFNQWMDDYTNNPEKFESMTSTVLKHLKEKEDGGEPSYGEACAAILANYMSAEA